MLILGIELDNLCEGALLAALLQFAPTTLLDHKLDLLILMYILLVHKAEIPQSITSVVDVWFYGKC